jgi:hypothetical protein
VFAFNDWIEPFGPEGNVGFIRVLFLAALLPLAIPLIQARRVQQKLQVGVRAEAEVLEGKRSAPGDNRTFGAMEHGLAIGTRRVHYVTGPREEAFTTDRPWTQQLGVGARMAVLVNPTQPEVWFDMGLLPDPPNRPL